MDMLINSVATLAAVVAAATAIITHIKSSKLQNKAIEYSLLENRIQLLKYIEQGQYEVDAIVKRLIEGKDWEIERFRCLFSRELVAEYDAITMGGSELEFAEVEIYAIEKDAFPFHIQGDKTVDEEQYNKYMTIRRQRENIIACPASADEWNEFRNLCEQSFGVSEGKAYCDKVKSYSEKNFELKECRKALLLKIEDEIRNSVK